MNIWIGGKKVIKMPDCELLLTCPFFKDMTQHTNELTALYEEQYCHGSYAWCGRYMMYKALERELERINSLDLLPALSSLWGDI